MMCQRSGHSCGSESVSPFFHRYKYNTSDFSVSYPIPPCNMLVFNTLFVQIPMLFHISTMFHRVPSTRDIHCLYFSSLGLPIVGYFYIASSIKLLFVFLKWFARQSCGLRGHACVIYVWYNLPKYNRKNLMSIQNSVYCFTLDVQLQHIARAKKHRKRVWRWRWQWSSSAFPFLSAQITLFSSTLHFYAKRRDCVQRIGVGSAPSHGDRRIMCQNDQMEFGFCVILLIFNAWFRVIPCVRCHAWFRVIPRDFSQILWQVFQCVLIQIIN